MQATVRRNMGTDSEVVVGTGLIHRIFYHLAPIALETSAKQAVEVRSQRLRDCLAKRCKTASDFDALCLDYFPEIHRRFVDGMDRVARENLLLTLVPLELLEGLLSPPSSTPAGDEPPCPYRGLDSFCASDAAWFFGREEATRELLELFEACHASTAASASETPLRLITVLGASGSGKSSLCQAGLLGSLMRRQGKGGFTVAVLRPEREPLRNLARLLARIERDPRSAQAAANNMGPLSEHVDRLEARLAESAMSLHVLASDILHDGAERLLVLVDQAEELFTPVRDPHSPVSLEVAKQAASRLKDHRERFLDNLLYAAAEPGGRVSVVMALRSDFLGACEQHRSFYSAIGPRRRTLVLGGMSEAQLTECIAAPAVLARRELDKGIVTALVEQSREHESVLPLLEYTLEQLWKRLRAAEAAGEKPDAAAELKLLGGVPGCLAARAEDEWHKLASPTRSASALEPGGESQAQRHIRRIFLRLLQPGEGGGVIRRRQALADLLVEGQTEAELAGLIERFACSQVRLLSLSSDEELSTTDGESVTQTAATRGQRVEITHEALVRHWTRLREWVEAKRDVQPLLFRLAAEASRWQHQDRPDWLLWRGGNLSDLKRHRARLDEDLFRHERAFVIASVRADRWDSVRRILVFALVCITLPIGVLGVVAWRRMLFFRHQGEQAIHRIQRVADFPTRIFQIYRKLESAPDATEIRRELLDSAGVFLDNMGEELRENSWALRIRMEQHSQRANVEVAHGKLAEAETEYRHAHALAQKLVLLNDHDSISENDLMNILDRRGSVARARGKLVDAHEYYEQALEITWNFADLYPNNSDWQRNRTIGLIKLGDLSTEQTKYVEAQYYYEQALEYRQKQEIAHPRAAQWKRDIHTSLLRIGDSLVAQGLLEKAKNYYQKGLDISKELVANQPQDLESQSSLWISHVKLGDVAQAQSDFKIARIHFEQCLKISEWQILRKPNDQERQHELALSYQKLGDLADQDQGIPDAWTAYKRSAELLSELLTKAPENAAWLRDLLISQLRLVELHEKQQEFSVAYIRLLDAKATLNRLEGRFEGDPQMEQFRASYAHLSEQLDFARVPNVGAQVPSAGMNSAP